MTLDSSSLSRRELGAMLALAGGAALLPGGSLAQVAHADDWRWLLGTWDVRHRRLRKRLAASTDWDEFAGKSALWLTMDGLGTIDDNLLELPGGTYRGLGVRAFDAAAATWSIWWLDGRSAARLDAPVRGRFSGDAGVFVGDDFFEGRPVMVRFRWHDIRGARPHWDQALSTDRGASWEINWRNCFARTAATPAPLSRLADAPRDFDFLVGRWDVAHRKLRRRLAGSDQWDAFGGTLVNWPALGGHGNVGDNVFDAPGGAYRGVGIRSYDAAAGQWSSWWLDGRSAAMIAPAVQGRFANGVGTFVGDDSFEGRPIRTRVTWSRITPRSARWEQAFSADGGASWETNWISDFARRG